MSTPTADGTYRARPRLLIADDDSLTCSTLSMELEEAFDLVGIANDADGAIALAQEQEPDVAIIDVQMPGGGGLRATLEISARVPDTAIVILSVDDQHETVVNLLSAGAMSYCRKGLSSHELTQQLWRSIQAHEHAS
jgi:DNA-binding NarL/FixJ family response regulator